MSGMAFDTLKTSKDLAAAGFEPAQAEALASAIATSLSSGVATKEDIAKLDGKIDSVRGEMKGDITRLDGKIDLLKWMVGAVLAVVTAVLLRMLFVTP
jgi:hypothetical protein